MSLHALFLYSPSHDDFTPTSTPLQSSELRLYTWKNATLGEIASLVKQAVPDQVDQAGPGGQMIFRHMYLDVKKGIYVGRDVGVIFLDGPGERQHQSSSSNSNPHQDSNIDRSASTHNDNATTLISQRSTSTGKTLESFNFVIGDYISIAFKPSTHERGVGGGDRSQFSHRGAAGGAGGAGGRDFRDFGGSGGGRFRQNSGGSGGPRDFQGAFRSEKRQRPNGHGQGRDSRIGIDAQNEPNWKSRGRGRGR